MRNRGVDGDVGEEEGARRRERRDGRVVRPDVGVVGLILGVGGEHGELEGQDRVVVYLGWWGWLWSRGLGWRCRGGYLGGRGDGGAGHCACCV